MLHLWFLQYGKLRQKPLSGKESSVYCEYLMVLHLSSLLSLILLLDSFPVGHSSLALLVCMKAQAACLFFFFFLGDLPGKIHKPVVCTVQLHSGYVFPSGTENLKDTGTVKPTQPGM